LRQAVAVLSQDFTTGAVDSHQSLAGLIVDLQLSPAMINFLFWQWALIFSCGASFVYLCLHCASEQWTSEWLPWFKANIAGIS